MGSKRMSQPSVPNRSTGGGGNKPDDRFCGTIGRNSGNTSPSNIAGGKAHPSQSPKARLFGTHPDEVIGENEPNISQISANATRTAPNMGKRLNDSPGSMKRGKA